MPALHGFIVLWPLATPTMALSKSASPKPTARSIARLGERAMPPGSGRGRGSSARGKPHSDGQRGGVQYSRPPGCGITTPMLVHPQFDPVAFHVGPLAVRWYGLMYLAGFVLFVVLGRRRARAEMLTGWRMSDVDDMLFFGVFGVILGGRLGYVLFYKPLYYFAHPLEL